MLNYTDEQIRNFLIVILKSHDFTFVPVGNHHLKRHLVYEITLYNQKKYIFKLYYRDRRRSREIASLKLLRDSTIRCPRIVQYGTSDHHEWLLTEHLEGIVLEDILEELSIENKVQLFQEIGEELGKIHSFAHFDYFGEWDERGEWITKTTDFYSYCVNRMESVNKTILTLELPEKNILTDAITYMRKNYELFKIGNPSRLTHNDFDGRNILVQKNDGLYRISGIIDFEGCNPQNSEEDLVGLYFKYLYDEPVLEEAFHQGYGIYITLEDHFFKRLKVYLVANSVANCSWAYTQAPDYFIENIQFIKKVLK